MTVAQHVLKLWLMKNSLVGVDTLPYLYRVLHQLASRWNSLSLQLSVSGQDEIQRSARSADICLAVSLVEWLQSGQATWKALVEAVFRPAGGGHQVLARDIARNYRSKSTDKTVKNSVYLLPYTL